MKKKNSNKMIKSNRRNQLQSNAAIASSETEKTGNVAVGQVAMVAEGTEGTQVENVEAPTKFTA